VKFNYRGETTRERMQEFLYHVYGVYLPKLNLTRRPGYDVEHYKIKDVTHNEITDTDPRTHIEAFSYYVPIKKPEAN
jgi:AraC family transcriptional activator of mar-sox-rob regulon